MQFGSEYLCSFHWARPRPIMPKISPIMLLRIAQNSILLCSKSCFQNQDYALELTVLLEYSNPSLFSIGTTIFKNSL